MQIPIIALTASAFKSEVDKCKTAGMDDYIAKPFEEFALIETISRNLHKEPKKRPDSAPVSTVEKERLYDLKNLQNISKGDQEFTRKMILTFIDQINELLPQAQAALGCDDFLSLSHLVHSIRPSIEIMGILSITAQVNTLEMLSREGVDKERISEVFSQVKSILAIAVEQLKEEIDRTELKP